MPLYHDAIWLHTQYHEKQLSQSEMGALYNFDQTTIHKWMKRLNIPARDTSKSTKQSWAKHPERKEKQRKRMEDKNDPIRSPAARKKISVANRGKVISVEMRERISNTLKKLHRDNPGMLSGKNNPSWKGGITPINRVIRYSDKYHQWREAIFEQDDHICQKCLNRGGNLHAHHIIPFSVAPEERFKADNGATLCEECHKYITLTEYSQRRI